MLILLPPSEGKADPADGPVLDLASLSLPELTGPRRAVLAAVTRLATGPRSRARAVLGLTERQDREIDRDARLTVSGTAPAGQVYSGVLFDALGYPSLRGRARARADRSVLVSSALFGVLRLTDRIPAYRLSGDVRLPRLGGVTAYWRRHLDAPLAALAAEDPVLDLRSGTYARAWTPTGTVAERTVVGRVLQRRQDGTLTVVSHHNKATKGRLVRALVSQPGTVPTVVALAERVAELGYEVDLTAPMAGRPGRLDIVVPTP